MTIWVFDMGEKSSPMLRKRYGAVRAFVYLVLAMSFGAAAPAMAKEVRILAFGDSLTAGYGLPSGQGFVPQLEDALRRNGIPARVTDAGVSGNTAGQGRARLKWTLDGLKQKPDLAIVALGGNDMLRALPPAQTRADMDAILAEFKSRNIPVLVAGMLSPPNLGPRYTSEFNSIFPDISRKYGAALYPFFLANVAGVRGLSLPDGVHPNFQGIKRMVSGILPTVSRALAKSDG
jgi:acyl-CoA thioesterase-1